ncbi:murein transglycosylase [Citrobacter sp. FDAARGOS_156]|nr:murein transglycosylase [Citrobacter sp. FDAARGOS_156]
MISCNPFFTLITFLGRKRTKTTHSGLFFAQNLRSGRYTHFIRFGGLLSSSRIQAT